MRHLSVLRLTAGLMLLFAVLPLAGAQSLGGGLGGLSLGTPSPTQQSPESLDKIVAVVNDDVILKSELDAAMAELKQRKGDRLGQLPPDVLRSQVLDQLITRKLQLQEADRAGIKVSKAQLKQGLSRIAQHNHMNLSQFVQAVTASGMSKEALQRRVRDEIKISKARQKNVMQKVSVSDSDVDHYLQNQSLRFARGHEYHLRQIQVAVPQRADTSTAGLAHDRLQQLRKQITDGKTRFADAARSVSDGAHAKDGGDMGWVSGGDLPDSFDTALAGLKRGQISSVFRGPDGLYLIKLEGERGSQKSQDQQQKVMVKEAHLRHIVLQPNEIRNDQQTRQLAQKIRERLQAGDDFGDLARQYSDDKATAQQGGNIGWAPLKRLPPDTRQHIEQLSKGQVSRIFQSRDGYEIVELLGKRQRDETQQAKRHKARQTLGRKRASEKGNLWLHKLRDEAYIDIRMPDYQPTSGNPGSSR